MKKILLLFAFTLTNVFYGQIPNTISNQEKVFGLSKFWQEVNYNFVYLNKVNRVEWDEMYKTLISEVQETKNDYQYYKLLQKFCAFLKDGHTNVWFPVEMYNNILFTDFDGCRLFVSNVGNKAIITRISERKKNEIPIGSEIIEVNGLKTSKFIKENVYPYISSSTDFVRDNIAVERMFEGYLGTMFKLKIKTPKGKNISLSLTIKHNQEKVFPPVEKMKLFEFKWINKDIAYIALNSFSDWEITESFRQKISELKKAKKLIIDLRNNGGGDSIKGKVILHNLTNDTIFYGPKTQSRLHIPTLKAWGRGKYYHDFLYKPDTLGTGDRRLLKNNRIVVPTAILIGHKTGSAAEDFLVYADKQEHMTKIGESTFGSTGQPFIFNLPNRGFGRVCTRKDTYPDGREFVGIGIKPDVEIRKSVIDYIENKDPVLEKAVQFLNEK